MLSTGWMLRTVMTAVTTNAVARMGFDGSAWAAAASARRTNGEGRSFDQKPSSKHARAGRMVNQLRNERLPLRMSMIWKRTTTAPAMGRARRGQKRNHGATSSASQLNQTPAFKHTRGRK